MRQLLAALALLTCLPVAGAPRGDAGSLFWYPLVGALLAAALWLLAWLLPEATEPMLAAALLLCALVWLTGALHLDGLADSMDALAGGHAAPERALEIMRDPRIGSMGAAALFLALLAKFALLAALWPDDMSGVFCALVLARANVPLLFASTAYVRQGGIAARLGGASGRWPAAGGLLCCALLLVWLPWRQLAAAAGAALAVLVCWRGLWRKRLGGFTGDIAGGLIELGELAVMLVFALWAG